jgi:four helix bundle protein
MGSFQNLEVWRKAHSLTLAIYETTKSFPKDEMYGLTMQMRRSAASIGANLAEGCGRNGDKEMSRFVRIALGSANELEQHLILAGDLDYLSASTCGCLSADITLIKRMLAKLLRRLGG